MASVLAPRAPVGVAAGGRGGAAPPVPWVLNAPATLALLALFVLPIGYVLLLSVTDPSLSLAHYRRIFSVPLYTRVLFGTFTTSLTVTIACLLMAYPFAYIMARRSDWVSTALLICVAVCFWTGFIVRTYAWLVILGNKGPVVAAYLALELGPPPQLLFTTFSSTLGMVHILLPYMNTRALQRDEEDRSEPAARRRQSRS